MKNTYYRFWDDENQLMTKSMSLAEIAKGKQIDYENGDYTEFTDFDFEKHLIPMLRSGTTDNNGKRLFNKDVIKLHGGTYVIEFTSSGFKLVDVRREISFFDDKEDFDYSLLHDEPLDGSRFMTLIGDWFTLKDSISEDEINNYKGRKHNVPSI